MSRDFTYIDDVVEAVIRLQKEKAIPTVDESWVVEQGSPATSSAPYCIYNIGNSRPAALMDYINALREELSLKKGVNVEIKKNMLPVQLGDMLSTCAEINALEQAISFRPKTTIKEGIKSFVEWYWAFYKVS